MFLHFCLNIIHRCKLKNLAIFHKLLTLRCLCLPEHHECFVVGAACNVKIQFLTLEICLFLHKFSQGYGMFSFCVVLFGGTVLHSSHSHSFFYLLWGVIGGIAALKMVSCINPILPSEHRVYQELDKIWSSKCYRKIRKQYKTIFPGGNLSYSEQL